jgi:hypothetical protein
MGAYHAIESLKGKTIDPYTACSLMVSTFTTKILFYVKHSVSRALHENISKLHTVLP